MRIVTVNVPESYIEAISKLTGAGGLFPSRSELIRVAVRKFLIKELKMAKKLIKMNNLEKKETETETDQEELDADNFVRVPINKVNEKNEQVREFKTFKILERLE